MSRETMATLPADINEPIDLLGSEKAANPWRVKVTRYLGANSYDLMRQDECCGGFTALEHLKDFAQLLRNDLARGLAMTTATKEEYRRIIAAIEEVSE